MDSVVIKSNKYGITLLLDDTIEFEPLIHQICRKFAQARDFFGQTSMVLELKGRELSDEEASVIIEAIELNSDIEILLLSEGGQLAERKIKHQIDKFYYEKQFNHAKIIKGHVGRNQQIVSDCSLIILGDVREYASVRAKGNILVFGALEGNAVAGDAHNNECFIVANEMSPQSVRIGDYEGPLVYQEKWIARTLRRNQSPVAAMVWEDSLLAEPLGSGLLKQI